MKPDRYEVSDAGRQRLSGTLQQRGLRMGLPVWGGFLFGLPFVAAGTAILLMAAGLIQVDPASIKAPRWVLMIAGGMFAVGGLIVWVMSLQEFLARRQCARATRGDFASTALQDFTWDTEGCRISGWAAAVKAILAAVLLTAFMSMFNWWAFVADGPLPVKLIVILFDLLVLFAWWDAFRKIGCAIKFGRSAVSYTRFPYASSEPVLLQWIPTAGVHRIESGRFTLRCVEQWMERSGSGRNRRANLVQEELWSAAWSLEQPRNFRVGDAVELVYELPGNAPSTHLNSATPIFWELEVHLDLSGLDFRERYLVPVYQEVAVGQRASS